MGNARAQPVQLIRSLDRQAGSSLGPTGIDDKAAILGAHPGTKTVSALALQVTGLESSLHGAVGSKIIVEGPQVGGPNQAAQITGFSQALSTAGTLRQGTLVVDNSAIEG